MVNLTSDTFYFNLIPSWKIKQGKNILKCLSPNSQTSPELSPCPWLKGKHEFGRGLIFPKIPQNGLKWILNTTLN